MELTKQQIIDVNNMSIEDYLEKGFTMEELLSIDKFNLVTATYFPSNSVEYFDGENWYNSSGEALRNPEEYDTNSEGYTPFGDE